MASGNARRFGSNKLMADYRGKPLYLYGLELLTDICAERSDCSLIVVSRYAGIRNTAASMGAMTVDCPESVKGASHTVKAGIRAIPHLQKEDRLLFSVADQPELKKQSLLSLLDFDGSTPVARLCWENTPGNPVLFSSSLVPELMALSGDQGGGSVAKHHPCTWYPAAEEELRDCDLPSDLIP